jgi:16S rRNA (adenine1518-N6/adenine1519-N6)-dimethyltransferase
MNHEQQRGSTLGAPYVPPPPPRQTLSFLQQLFRERGIEPKNKLGQNFLIDLNLVEVLVRTAELSKDDLAIEIGSGTGSLTTRLADAAGAVLSVEIDPAFHSLVSELVGDRDNVVLLRHDVLKNKNHLSPLVFEALAALETRIPCKQRKLVANLPYSVGTPIITNFLLSDVAFERMVVTVQWEIAERLMTHPAREDFGALAVMVQSLADVQLLRRLGPAVFWPRPKVDSAIICIRPNKEKRAQLVGRLGNVQRLRHFLRDLYTHRRKNLRGALTGWPSGRRSKEEVDQRLAELGIDGTVRAETLDIEQHLRLCEVFG